MIFRPNLRFYSFLSRLVFRKSYEGKIMLVAFAGTHIPLLTLVFYFILSSPFTFEVRLQIFLIALLATLIGTAITLFSLHNLLAPITLTVLAMRDYLSKQKLPNLPTIFMDEVGTLMADTSYTLKKLDEVIKYMADYDDLTGLPNRSLFRNRLQQTLAQRQSSQQMLAVLSLSLDRLEAVSNTLGYDISDLLIRNIALRSANCIGDMDIIARLDSNKFGIFQTNIDNLDQVMKLSQALLNIFSFPFFLDNHEIRIGANIGISIYPNDYQGADQLLENADVAMHQAKNQGRNTYQFYSVDLNESLQERLLLENELYGALQRQEFLLYYQPQISLATGQIVGVEALIRWQNPLRGMVSPAKFIPIAEETGLIVSIGEWVLHTACAQNLAWQIEGFAPLRMAVNLSARQFKQRNLMEMVINTLAETGLKANYLELELTEGLLIDNVEQSIAILEELHSMGIIFALDDFGTGYSSLSYLKRFPLQALKIDQSFVRDMTIDPNSAAITEAIISLARGLQLKVIAEGVETQEQLDYLKAKGCDEVQGYYLSRPLPAEGISKLLASCRDDK